MIKRAGRQALLQAAEDSAAGAGNAAEDARQGQHLPQLLRPLARSHGRRNQQAHHEDHAGQLQAEHDGDHDQRGEQHVQQAQTKAVGVREVRVEGDELEFLPQRHEDGEGYQAHGADQHHILTPNGRRLTEDELVEARLTGIVARLDVGQQRDTEGEEGR